MKKAIAQLPEVLDDDEAQEERRAAGVVLVRSLIARRWFELEKLWLLWQRPDLEDFISSLRAFVHELLVVYGDHCAFPPMPSDACLDALLEDADKMRKAAHGTKDVSGSSTSTSSSKRSHDSVIPHEFRYLVNSKSTWTVLKVHLSVKDLNRDLKPWLQFLCFSTSFYSPAFAQHRYFCLQVPPEEGLDGYRHYLATSEWWNLRTPFYQWYTKNYTSGLVPLLEDLRLSVGHATCWQMEILS